jgi:hypothetical protein
MKTQIEVENRKEGKLIRRGLADPEVRALVKVMGALHPIKSKNMKRLVLEMAEEHFKDHGVRG